MRLGCFIRCTSGGTRSPTRASGLVDLEYTVAEKPSDRLDEVSGYGGGRCTRPCLGLSFNTTSARAVVFDSCKAWTPLPAGDGQTLSLARADQRGLLPELQPVLHRARGFRRPQAEPR